MNLQYLLFNKFLYMIFFFKFWQSTNIKENRSKIPVVMYIYILPICSASIVLYTDIIRLYIPNSPPPSNFLSVDGFLMHTGY
jgi:hypothetical protein